MFTVPAVLNSETVRRAVVKFVTNLSVKNKNIIKNESGFSIIEAIFAASFFVIALVPVMGIASLSFDVAARIRNNIVASNLAQEGLEVVLLENPEEFMGAIGAHYLVFEQLSDGEVIHLLHSQKSRGSPFLL